MNRNIFFNKNFLNVLKSLNSDGKIQLFFQELLTEAEITTLSKRWRILELLSQNVTQREIAEQLGVSLCKVTRGSKILKNKKSITSTYFERIKRNEYTRN